MKKKDCFASLAMTALYSSPASVATVPMIITNQPSRLRFVIARNVVTKQSPAVPALAPAFSPRHCEEHCDEAIPTYTRHPPICLSLTPRRLLRSARNDCVVVYYPPWHATVRDAYNAAGDGDSIQAVAATFAEDLNFDRNIPITLMGGFNSNFPGNDSFTTVSGSLTISNGTVIIDNAKMKCKNKEGKPEIKGRTVKK